MIPIAWSGPPPAFREPAERCTRQALAALRLTGEVRSVVLAPLDGHLGDDAWIRWTRRRPVRVWLQLEVGCFLTPGGRRHAARRGLRLGKLPARRFSARAFREALFHELFHVRDELRYGVRVLEVPPPLRQRFNEVWNVWIDGRLSRLGYPGLRRSGRRAYFAQLFSGGPGLAGPARRVFENLWNADRLGQEELLEAVAELGTPRPLAAKFSLAARRGRR